MKHRPTKDSATARSGLRCVIQVRFSCSPEGPTACMARRYEYVGMGRGGRITRNGESFSLAYSASVFCTVNSAAVHPTFRENELASGDGRSTKRT